MLPAGQLESHQEEPTVSVGLVTHAAVGHVYNPFAHCACYTSLSSVQMAYYAISICLQTCEGSFQQCDLLSQAARL